MAVTEKPLVLVVDDEPTVRQAGARMLESLGLRVVVADDGREGLARFRQHHQELRLVLLDMVLPNMDGQATFEAMRAHDPSVPILACTAYAEPNVLNAMLAQGLAGYLTKPYRLAELKLRLSNIGLL